MIEIKSKKIKKENTVFISGSKSYTHRMLIASALADGTSYLNNALCSDDTNYTASALMKLGIKIQKKGSKFIVNGRGGNFLPFKDEIFLGNSGTSMRLLCSLGTLGEGRYLFNGTKRMQQRPVHELIRALNALDIKAVSINGNDCPPIEIFAKKIQKKDVSIDCSSSSQYLSSLLLIAPFTKNGLFITPLNDMVSKPYVDMTLNVMDKFGIKYERDGYNYFSIEGRQTYKSGSYEIKPDASNSSYFFLIAAITKSKIKVKGLKKDSLQGDIKFLTLLEKMGAKVSYEEDGISVLGKKLKAIKVDMADMPDMVPSLAVAALFAEGTTEIFNISHLSIKESNRIESVSNELLKLGADVKFSDSSITIKGGTLKRGSKIKTYDDHRIAMSFAPIGLVQKGIFIEDEDCVKKSFPKFWQIFESLYE